MSKTSATPENESASDLLDRWMAHRQQQGDDTDGAPTVTEDLAPAGSTEPAPVTPEDPMPPATTVPSEVDAGRAVLEALVERLESPAGVAEEETDTPREVPAEPETAETTPGEPEAEAEPVREAEAEPEPEPEAEPAPEHLGSAAGAPSSEVMEEGASSEPPRDERPAPGTTSASAAAISAPPAVPPAISPVVPPAGPPAPAKPPTPIRRPPVAPAPGLVLKSPQRAGRRALGVLALLAAAGTVAAGWVAWTERTPVAIGLAAGLAGLVWLLLAWRSRIAPPTVTVDDGQLLIVQGHSRHQFPLSSTYPPIDILGSPGDRGWKALIQRRGMGPFVVTRTMVDPQEFSDVVRFYRPNA